MARNFNGSSDKVAITGPLIVAATNYSIFAWVRPASTSAGAHNVFASGGTSYTTQLRRSGSDWNFFHHDGAGADQGAIYAGGVSSAVWTAIGATWDQSNIRIYVGGVLRATTAASGLNAVSIGTVNSVGYDAPDGNIQFWDGDIQVPTVWSGAALSAGEMAALAQGIHPIRMRPQFIIGFWPLDGLVSPEPDLSGNKNNGTVTGTTLSTSGAPVEPITRQVPRSFAAAAPSFIPAWAAPSNFGQGYPT